MALDQKQVEKLSAALNELKVDLEASITVGLENSKPVDLSKPIGRLTRMDEIAQQNMAKANLEANRKKLRSVDAALKAMNEGGNYGECYSCGEQITFGRLLAQPESTLCIECKEERENFPESSGS